ncbi:MULTISPECIES: DUF2809 domain-containing protein [Streptomyces]|uniref:ribosomal maturation YjgA family protein n=1 Tax=Streptomyces TaxID=1883 RepID=UPI0009964A58|nr:MULTISPECIES: DUF2809 domain-containing protein [Streptomyces]RPK93471.1 hypothetical protein EES46_06170 [Streptomyces sp. ADI98-10]
MRLPARPSEPSDDSAVRPLTVRAVPARASRIRAVAAVAAVVTVASGLAVRAGADGAFAKYAGSALYTVLLCTLVAFCAPRARPVVVASTALAVSWAVEFAQLTGVPAELSAHSTVARLVLGSTFNAPDLLWYAVGAAAAWAVHAAARRLATRQGGSGGS